MAKKRSLKSLKAEAWRVFALWIRRRDKKCVTCGGPNEQAGHFIHGSLDIPLNVHSQCVRCNFYKSGAMTDYTLFMIDRYGRWIVDYLKRRAREVRRPTREELERIIEKYKEVKK